MKTFQYPAQLEEINEYINSLPKTICTFDNENGIVIVEVDDSQPVVEQ